MNAAPRREPPAKSQPFVFRHASSEEYAAFVRQRLNHPDSIAVVRRERARFVRAYPDLENWFGAPLAERIGRLAGEKPGRVTCRVSHEARGYLHFLALRGYARFDYPWLIALRCPDPWTYLGETGLEAATDQLVAEGVALGYRQDSARRALRSEISRIYLRTLVSRIDDISEADLDEFEQAVRAFGERPDVDLFFGSASGYGQAVRRFGASLHLLRVILYHRGQIATEPRRTWSRPAARPVCTPRMAAVAERYLEARRTQGSRPSTLRHLTLALREFMAWLARTYPDLESFAEVTRAHVLEYAAVLTAAVVPRTGRPFAANTQRGRLCSLAIFFHDVAAWG